jgi:lipoprotein-anchoring transpeptidase ErfK/SrfK
VRRSLRLLLALAAACLALGAGAGTAGAAVKVVFLQGEQNVAVTRPGSTPQDAVRQLLLGPTSAEARTQIRTYVPAGTALRRLTVSNGVATVDLSLGFVQGNDAQSLLARLSQVVSTLTAAPGVARVQVLIGGGIPLGLFPGVDATGPLDTRDLATPSVAPPKAPPTPTGPETPSVRTLQQRLADLGYLPADAVDGTPGPATANALIAFQKWQGLQRDGTLGPQTQAALAGAVRPTPIARGGPGRRVEVLIDRQLVLAIQDDQVVRAIAVSTGKPSTPTPTGSFKVYAKFPRWWSTPFQEWLLWAAPFVGGVALHQFPDVPAYAASHGCVRVTRYDEPWLFDFVSVGTPVAVLARST